LGGTLTETELVDQLAAGGKEGYLPNSVAAYPTPGEIKFATVFRKNTTNAVWEVHRNLTAAELKAKAKALAERQFTPASVTACPWDGAVLTAVCGSKSLPSRLNFRSRPRSSTKTVRSKTRLQAPARRPRFVVANMPGRYDGHLEVQSVVESDMSHATLEDRVTRLEQLMDQLLRTRPKSSQPGRDDWQGTFGMFAGDPVMKEIIEAGRRIREEDRQQAEP